MDNRKIDLTLEGIDDFRLAMLLAIGNRKTVGYLLQDNKMILYWSDTELKGKITPLPYIMDSEPVISFVWGWLKSTKPTNPEPDHDGHNGKGFHIYSEQWGRVNNQWQAYIAIEPEWAWYGK